MSGNPPGTVTVQLTQGHVAIVDIADLAKVSLHSWHAGQAGRAGRAGRELKSPYARTSIRITPGRKGKKSSLFLHRYLLDAGPGQVVDHINGDTLDNRRANLRLCTHRQNSSNVVSSKNAKLGKFKGVYQHKKSGRWCAQIAGGEVRENGKRRLLHLGCFATPELAAQAYDAAARKFFGDFASLNFPDLEVAS